MDTITEAIPPVDRRGGALASGPVRALNIQAQKALDSLGIDFFNSM